MKFGKSLSWDHGTALGLQKKDRWLKKDSSQRIATVAEVSQYMPVQSDETVLDGKVASSNFWDDRF